MFKRKRCQHQWEEVGRTFTEGTHLGWWSIQTYDPIGEIQRLKAGQTHIELKCKLCGDVGGRTLRGVHKQ